MNFILGLRLFSKNDIHLELYNYIDASLKHDLNNHISTSDNVFYMVMFVSHAIIQK